MTPADAEVFATSAVRRATAEPSIGRIADREDLVADLLVRANCRYPRRDARDGERRP